MDEKEKKDIAGDADACADCTAGDTEDKKSAGCAKDAKDKKEHSGSEAKKHKSRIAELERELEEEKKKSAEVKSVLSSFLAAKQRLRGRRKIRGSRKRGYRKPGRKSGCPVPPFAKPGCRPAAVLPPPKAA